MAGVPGDRLIRCVTDVATHVSPMSRLRALARPEGVERAGTSRVASSSPATTGWSRGARSPGSGQGAIGSPPLISQVYTALRACSVSSMAA